MFTTGSTMVLRVDHHEESMVETSFTCAEAPWEKTAQSASTRILERVVLEVLKFFIMMWFENPIRRSAPA